MSNFGFKNVPESARRTYLKRAGLHMNAKFLSLTYVQEKDWEGFDIELETAEGDYFKERTFGPNIDKVYPKDIYVKGVKDRLETRQEAFDRVLGDINTKLLYLATCFVDKDLAISKVSEVKTLKEFVNAVSNLIGEPSTNINFLTIWKNSDKNKKSNLILAERIKWCEAYQEGVGTGLKLTTYQQNNQTTEKYPYGSAEAQGDNGVIGSSDVSNYEPAPEEVSDLPF